ncbi:hypothetical protein BHE74_00022173 [Ensete ventricosum]|nr:hypothetical protein BHE74_00022173 [Ensete ventricosum]
MPMTDGRTAAHLNSMEKLGLSVLHQRSGETWIDPDCDPLATFFSPHLPTTPRFRLRLLLLLLRLLLLLLL